MLITRKKFSKGGTYWLGPGMAVCRKVITKLFCIPVTSRVLWVGLFSIQGDKRYREPLEVTGGRFWPILRSDVMLGRQYYHPFLDKKLTPYIGKTVYMECWYE